MPSVLLVHPDAEQWLAAVPGASAEVTTVGTAQGARAYLAGTAFDAVYVGPGVEGAEAIAALRDVLGLATPVVHVEGPDDVARRLAAPAPAPTGPVAGGRTALEEIRDELGRVVHALNNPLAVIAGNAQLGSELAQAVPTDETIVDALRAITDAAARLETLFADVAALRALVDRALEADGEA